MKIKIISLLQEINNNIFMKLAVRKNYLLFCMALILILNLTFTYAAYTKPSFSFVVLGDQRFYTGSGAYNVPNFFRGACENIYRIGAGEFLISVGDLDPSIDTEWTIHQYLGTNYMWFPVVGEHDLPGGGIEPLPGINMKWFRDYNYDSNGIGLAPDIVNNGPSGCPQTTYSFDYENSHFVVLNEYCDVTGDTVGDGNISTHLYNWLAADLATTTKQHVFVFGHEPAFPEPDMNTERLRYATSSLNQYPLNRDQFWNLLKSNGVIAYFCGHTNNFSVCYENSVWQVDTGHARGAGDSGAPSTFLVVNVDDSFVSMKAYRDIHDGVYDYDDIVFTGVLSPTPTILVSKGSTWKYLDDGSDQGTAWVSSSFDDSSWKSGPGQLGYGDGDESTIISYGPDPNNKYITTYFRHNFFVLHPAAYSGLLLRMMRDDGGVVYLNGLEVFRSNMPAGIISYNVFALTPMGGSEEDAYYTVDLDPSLLVPGNNVLAVEIHQASLISSDLSFDLELIAMDKLPNAVPTIFPGGLLFIIIVITVMMLFYLTEKTRTVISLVKNNK